MKRLSLLCVALLACLQNPMAQSTSAVLPSKAHLEWADAEVGVLIH